MKRACAVLTAAVVAFAAAAPLFAEAKTVKGEVVDVQCHAKKAENTGTDHESCAMSCARRGAKMGILAPDGVYVITGDYAADKNKKLLEFVAKTVTAKGDVAEVDGQKTINIASIKLES
jgi:hypothetical protein